VAVAGGLAAAEAGEARAADFPEVGVAVVVARDPVTLDEFSAVSGHQGAACGLVWVQKAKDLALLHPGVPCDALPAIEHDGGRIVESFQEFGACGRGLSLLGTGCASGRWTPVRASQQIADDLSRTRRLGGTARVDAWAAHKNPPPTRRVFRRFGVERPFDANRARRRPAGSALGT
jgi:hypothetical protein